MFNAMAQSMPAGTTRATLESVQCHVDRSITIGVNAKLPALPVGFANHLFNLFWSVVQGAAIVAAQIGFALVARAALVGAI